MESVVSSQLKKTLFLLATIYLLLPSLHATDVKYCDREGNYAVKVKEVVISPNPVVKGESATFNISASTGQAISGGNVVIVVSFFWLHVYAETRDLCGETSCPVEVGSFVLSHTQTLPSFTPTGSYTLKMTIKDTNNQQLTCISFQFKIGSGGSVTDN